MSARIDQRLAGNYSQITRTTPDPPWSFLFSTQLNLSPHQNEWSVFEKCFSIPKCLVRKTCRHGCAIFWACCAIFCQWTCKYCKIVYYTLFWGKILSLLFLRFFQLWWHEHSSRLQIGRIFRFWIKINPQIVILINTMSISMHLIVSQRFAYRKNISSILNQNCWYLVTLHAHTNRRYQCSLLFPIMKIFKHRQTQGLVSF